MVLYHGSKEIVEYPEIRKARFQKDFYFGFYCTLYAEQAKRWATRYGDGYINKYEYVPSSTLNCLYFEEMTEEWLDFIVACRRGIPHKYDIVEGPMAGGHLGFQESVLENIENIDFDAILCGVIDSKKPYEEKYTKKIPVAAAGGIFDRQDIDHVLSLGADAVQIASRFVVTKECDASDAYKRAYIEAGKGNIQIVKSPVGMPGRAVRNAFIRQVEQHKQEITGCYQCLEKCNPKEVPYCITQALIHAVKGELEQGLIFCGENVSRIHEMTTVPELMRELTQG